MIKIHYLTGEMELQPVRYWITTSIRYRWFWSRLEYYVESEFTRIGPFSTYDEAASFKLGCERV